MRTGISLFVMCLVCSVSHADCGDISRRLLSVEIGGPRTYLAQAPKGMSLSPVKHEWPNAGIDVLSGSTVGFSIAQAHVLWHENRIVEIVVTIKGASSAEIDEAVAQLLNIARTGFIPGTVPPSQFLRCTDGLLVRIGKAVLHGPQATVPIATLLVSNPVLKKAMQTPARSASH